MLVASVPIPVLVMSIELVSPEVVSDSCYIDIHLHAAERSDFDRMLIDDDRLVLTDDEWAKIVGKIKGIECIADMKMFQSISETVMDIFGDITGDRNDDEFNIVVSYHRARETRVAVRSRRSGTFEPLPADSQTAGSQTADGAGARSTCS